MFDGCEHDKNDKRRCEVGVLVIEMRRKVFYSKALAFDDKSELAGIQWSGTMVLVGYQSVKSVNGRLTTMLLSQAI